MAMGDVGLHEKDSLGLFLRFNFEFSDRRVADVFASDIFGKARKVSHDMYIYNRSSFFRACTCEARTMRGYSVLKGPE